MDWRWWLELVPWLARLAWILLLEMVRPRALGRRRFLGLGARYLCTWLAMAARLALFALALMPAFARVGAFLALSPRARLRLGVRYGAERRSFLDVYGLRA